MSGHTDPTLPTFGGGAHGWDLTQWRKLALLWGYTDRWSEWLGGTKSEDGQWTGETVAVPPGYVYVVQKIFILNASGGRGLTFIYLTDVVKTYYLAYEATLTAWTPLLLAGPLVLKAGDKCGVIMSSCIDKDDIRAGVWGYKMAVTE